jgi:hypothetical protein
MPAGDQVANAETRSTIYQALALGWRYPSREVFEAYSSGQYAEELLEYATALPHLAGLVTQEAHVAETMAAGLAGVPFEGFEVAYVATFDNGFPEPPCPPYEGLYNKNMERAQVMVEAQAAHEGAGELLHGYRLAQKDFLERHMTGWLPAFAARLEQEADVPFFPDLARFTIGFTNAELGLVSSLLQAEAGAQPIQETEAAGVIQ